MSSPAARKSRSKSVSSASGVTTIPEGNLVFAIPKKGRLYAKLLELLKGIGLEFRREERLDIAHSHNLPISLVFLPAKDIATFVANAHVDLGITGEDIIAESQADVKIELCLDMGKCRLALQAPQELVHLPLNSWAGKRIVTSFPHLTKTFFDKLDAEEKKTTRIQCISGSVEAACGLGLADAVVDLVETGTTMRAAGLEEVTTLMTTQTVLISNKESVHGELITQLRRRMQGWMTAQKYNMVTYNIERSKMQEGFKITPGIKAPTVIELALAGWVAVNAMVPSKEVPDVMEKLSELGATGIMATEIKNCRI